MAPTKHKIVRLTDEHWSQLAEAFRLVVPSDRRPPHARPDTDWQVTEGLRMIADGSLKFTVKKKTPALREPK